MSRSVQGSLKLLLWMAYDQLNWFRIHLLAFIVVPFIFSGFMAAANPTSGSGKQVTGYIDNIFMSFSAMTGTGLETVDVSGMRPLQQVFLVLLMIMGDISSVSLITIFCRQMWFRRNCRSAVATDRLSRRGRRKEAVESAEGSTTSRAALQSEATSSAPRLQAQADGDHVRRQGGEHRTNDNHGSPTIAEKRDPTPHRRPSKKRKKVKVQAYPGAYGFEEREKLRRRARGWIEHGDREPKTLRGTTTYSVIPHAATGRAAHTGRGGFPGPHRVLAALLRVIAPRTAHRVYTFVATDPQKPAVRWAHPIQSVEQAIGKPLEAWRDAEEARQAERVRWLPVGVRGVVVGRNSQIYDEELDADDLELFAAIEYRALNVLTGLVIAHQLLYTVIPFAILSIYFSKVHNWDGEFIASGQEQIGTVSKVWFSLFQSIAAYTSCGMSLVDSSMLSFQTCYLMIYVLVFPILAGNQAMPSFLRLELWIFSKFVTPGSELDVLVHFLLTHSRRMFIYLFPSYQTWWLVFIQSLFILGGLLGYIILNIGLEFYRQLSGWQNFSDGLFQSMSIRSAGFDIFELENLAPALHPLVVSGSKSGLCSLVLAIRSTNVYEERALGIHPHGPEKVRQPGRPGGEIFSRYVIDHLLPQIAFDLWPIVLATGAICVVERHQLLSSNDFGWFTIWHLLWEVTSAYCTVGASFGNPYSTASFSGSFRKIPKLIMILIMLRGRHRGLPAAIDRATMLPVEYLRLNTDDREKGEEERVETTRQDA